MKKTGSQIVMEALVREGVETIFGYPGGVVLPLYDEMLNWPKVSHVLVRHEQGAAHMADGYARATGKTGVCLATSGPGATNLVTGIATAMMDSVPMVAITGQVNSWSIGKDAFQETDIQGISIPITKHNYLVMDVDDLPRILAEAFYLAQEGRKGPVLVDIPKDVFLAETEVGFPYEVDLGRPVAGKPDPDVIKEAAAMLADSKKPVIIAGAGVLWSEAWDDLRELAEKCDLPVVNSLLGLGGFPRGDARSLGMMGMHGEAAATMAVQDADLVLGVGIRFDDRLTGKTSEFAPRAKVIHFDIDPTEFGKSVDTYLAVKGNLNQSLKALTAKTRVKKLDGWWKQIRQMQTEYPLVVPEDGRLLSRHVLGELNRITRGDAIVSTDVGQHQMWTAQYYRCRNPRSFISSGGLGTMGYGLPAAMGAKYARPDDEVWAVVGDGGFQMTLQELQTAADDNLNVNICLLNNGFLGMVRQWQELFYDNRHSHVAISSPDYRKLAAAFGVKYLRCEDRAKVEDTILDARSHDGPTLCEFVVEMEENVFPMVAAGAGNDSLIMDPELKKSPSRAAGVLR